MGNILLVSYKMSHFKISTLTNYCKGIMVRKYSAFYDLLLNYKGGSSSEWLHWLKCVLSWIYWIYLFIHWFITFKCVVLIVHVSYVDKVLSLNMFPCKRLYQMWVPGCVFCFFYFFEAVMQWIWSIHFLRSSSASA